MNLEELRKFVEMLSMLSVEKQKEFYFMVKGAALVADTAEKKGA